MKDLVVLELASVLAGPAVGMFFAELGATVIKVEAPTGDVTRGWKLASEDSASPLSAYFCSINYNKEYLRLDLKSDQGQEKLRQLITQADVVLTNNPNAQAKKLGLDKQIIRSINPKVIHGHIRGFAATDRVAYDAVLQAETGYISMTGSSQELAKLPIAMIDVLAGHQLKEGLLVALLEHADSGAYVEVSLEAAALSGLINQASNFLMQGHVAKAMGTQHPNIAPYGDLFHSADGKQILLACGSEAQFHALCSCLNAADILEDERFSNNSKRLKNRHALVDGLSLLIKHRVAQELLDQLHELRVPCAMVRSLDMVLEGETAQAMLLEETIEGMETKRLRGNAFTIAPYAL